MFKKSVLTFSFSAAALMLSAPGLLSAAEVDSLKKQDAGYYKDIYDQNFHGELVNQLDVARVGRKIFKKPLRAKNVNIFDEVPDSSFFTNRHARKALTTEELKKGSVQNNGPDLSSDLIVMDGKSGELDPVYFVKDARGDEYYLNFDSPENQELETSAKVITSRFYYALGYNVPEYTLAVVPEGKLKAGENAHFRDGTGFVKKLTQEFLNQNLMFIPQTLDGSYRTAASKKLSGTDKGSMTLGGHRKNEPDDLINHRDRREIRALTVFAAWLNDADIRECYTRDILLTENNQTFMKHYINHFGSTLGAAFHSTKPPSLGYEYTADFGEVTKAFLSLGFWEKPWQKKWREAGEQTNASPAVGYFNNLEFAPGKYKTQMPYEAFKRLTRADGVWAAKQIIAFRDDDIRAMVSEGKLTLPEDAETISKTLIERRDLIAKYWFTRGNPLDDFQVLAGKLMFKDLEVVHGFEKPETRSYFVTILDEKNKPVREQRLTATELDLSSIQGSAKTVEIRTAEKGPFVRVQFNSDSILSIVHQD